MNLLSNNMNVKLLNYTKLEPINGYIAGICYNKESNEKGFYTAINKGHYSVLEHFYLTFKISNISRVCTHQLVRHRISSYTQSSQRHSKINYSEDWYVIPESFHKCDKELLNKVCSNLYNISKLYEELINNGIPKEDARYILPEATYTNIIISCNLRAFMEQAQKRLCKTAQWEIRNMFTEMSKLVIKEYPFMEKLLTPNCKRIKCFEARNCSF